MTQQEKDTSTADFRADLAHDYHVNIGHFSRNGVSFFDEEYANIKRRSNQSIVQVPKLSLQNLNSVIQKEIHNYTKISKFVELQENAVDGQSMEEFNSSVDAWSNVFKIPQNIPKFVGKNGNMWRTGIYSHIYRLLVREYDTLFEEDRDLTIKQLPSIKNLMLLGIQKTKEIRTYLSKYRSMTLQHQSLPTVESLSFQGEALLPFFACKEACDKSSHLQAENELACALKTLVDTQVKFFSLGGAPQRKRLIFGLVIVGPNATSYVMRRKFVNENTVEDIGKEEHVVLCLQPLESYNFNVFDDLIRLAGFMNLVRKHGEELYKEASSKFRGMTQPPQGSNHADSNKGDQKSKARQPIPKPSPSEERKRAVEDSNSSKPNKKPKSSENETASSTTTEEEDGSDLDERKD